MTITKQKDNALNNVLDNSDELHQSKETSPQNLITFSSSTEPHALELNRRLKTFEQNISAIEKKLTISHNSFRQSIADLSKKTVSNASYIGLSQTQLRSLDDSYKSLSLQSDILTKKTSSLSTLFERSDKKQSESLQFIDNKLIENNNLLNIQIRKIQSDLSVLENNHQQVELQSKQLLTNINKLTQNLQNSTQTQNQKIKSVEKNTELKMASLENQIKQIINSQNNDLEQLKSTITKNEKKLNNEFSVINKLVNHVAKEQKQQFKQFDEQFSSSNQKLKQDIINSDKKHNISILQESSKFRDELQSVAEKNEIQHHQTKGIIAGLSDNLTKITDKVLKFRQQLEQKIEKNHIQTLSEFNNIDARQLEYDRQINTLQKANSHLNYRTDSLDESVAQLNKETANLELEQNNIHQQVIVNSEQEKIHFTYVSASLLIMVVVLSAGFLYTWQDIYDKNQLLLTQQMDQDIALNDQNISHDLLKQTVVAQSQTIEQKNSHQQKLATRVQKLYSDLEKQKKLNTHYQQQLKKQQNKIQTELQIVDTQTQYLNHTVGPYHEFTAGKLEGPLWLNSQNELNVTIKLQIFNHMQDIYAFIEDEGYYLKHNLAFYPMKKDDKTQYMLVYGSFGKTSQAKLALYDLPYQLSEQSKGIVSMKDIQLSLL